MSYNIAVVNLDGFVASIPVNTSVSSVNKRVTNFVVAVNHYAKEESNRKTSFFEVEAWGSLGDNCINHLKKGSKVTILGDLRQEQWKDPNHQNKSRVKIIAKTVRFD
jgi:single-strand DNA-binding protein